MSFTKNFNMNTITQADINSKLNSISGNIIDYFLNNIFFETSFTQSNTKSLKARSIFLFANPIDVNGKRYKNYIKNDAEQLKIFGKFAQDMKNKIDKINISLKVTFFNLYYAVDQEEGMIRDDFKLIVFSFSLVLVYVSFHLGSIFLGCMSMFGIGLSFPLALYINWHFFQIKYFASLHLTAIFVILGIAADDIFVFTDQWKQSATIPELNNQESRDQILLKRMNFTLRRTSKAIFTTSVTT